MRRWRLTSLLALFLTLLLAYYLLYEVYWTKRQKEAREKEQKVFDISKEQIQELKIKKDSQEIWLKKAQEAWSMEKPWKAQADEEKVSNLLESIVELKKGKIVEEKPSEIKSYGFEEPSILTFKALETVHSLYLGYFNPAGDSVFIKKDQEPALFLLDRSIKDGLLDPFDYRDKTVLAFKPEEVQKIKLKGEALTLEIEKQASGEWWLSQPLKVKADAERIDQLLKDLRNSQVTMFVDEEPTSLAPYGLDTPSWEITLWEGKEQAQKELLVGLPSELKAESIYAKGAATDTVFLISKSLSDLLPKEVKDLRDKSLLAFEKEIIHKVSVIHQGKKTLCVKKGADEWLIEEPIKVNGDSSKINSLIWDLKYAKVKDFVKEDAKNLADYGLQEPFLEINLYEEGKEEPKKVMIGKKESQEGYYASTSESGVVYLIEAQQVEELPKTTLDLRDKRLLSFQPNEIEKISLLFPEQPEMELKRDEEEWKIIKPQQTEVEESKIEGLLWDLSLLEFADIATEKADSLVPFGLDKPSLKITLTPKEKKEQLTFSLGSPSASEGMHYVMVNSEPKVYKVEDEFLKEFPTSRTDIKP